MDKQLILRLSGNIAPENRVSLRTISHTLPHLQRAIDKLVLFEQHGEIRKHATLPNAHYDLADLYLEQLESGSVKLPLIGNLLDGVGARLNQFLREPYQQAAQDIDEFTRPIQEQLAIAHNNVAKDNTEIITQKHLIEQNAKLDRHYAQAAVLKDINTMLSPLRAQSSANDSITLINNTSGKTAQYEFNQENSKTFGKIVGKKRLWKPIIYTGKLEGLRKTGSKALPYTGDFTSDTTNREHKLLIGSEADALRLNKHNLNNKSFSIWACPMAIYDSFDIYSGDIVFVDFKH